MADLVTTQFPLQMSVNKEFLPKGIWLARRRFNWTSFSGSDIAEDFKTTAERVGDKWILNVKNADWQGSDTADVVPVFARDVAGWRMVKCFIVRGKPWIMQNQSTQDYPSPIRTAILLMKNVEVPDSDRLVNINGFWWCARIWPSLRGRCSHCYGEDLWIMLQLFKYAKDGEQFKRPPPKLFKKNCLYASWMPVAVIAYSTLVLLRCKEKVYELMLNSALC